MVEILSIAIGQWVSSFKLVVTHYFRFRVQKFYPEPLSRKAKRQRKKIISTIYARFEILHCNLIFLNIFKIKYVFFS